MATCTPDEVKELTGSTLADDKIQPFIDAAEILIDRASDCADVTTAAENKAHCYLSSHFLVTSRVGKGSAQIKSQKLEDAYAVTYAQGAGSGSGIMSTSFGSNANMFMNGCLADLEKTQPDLVSIGTIGDAETATC